MGSFFISTVTAFVLFIDIGSAMADWEDRHFGRAVIEFVIFFGVVLFLLNSFLTGRV